MSLFKMKYLVFQHEDMKHERIYLFPAEVQHKDFAKTVPDYWKAIRGGFVCFFQHDADGNVLQGQFKCMGEAFSLRLQSDPEQDLILLTNALVQ